jgi:hypothetical protein
VVRTKGKLVGRLIGTRISCFDASDLADLDEGDQSTATSATTPAAAARVDDFLHRARTEAAQAQAAWERQQGLLGL